MVVLQEYLRGKVGGEEGEEGEGRGGRGEGRGREKRTDVTQLGKGGVERVGVEVWRG